MDCSYPEVFPPPAYISESREIEDRDLQGLSGDIIMCRRWNMWASETDL